MVEFHCLFPGFSFQLLRVSLSISRKKILCETTIFSVWNYLSSPVAGSGLFLLLKGQKRHLTVILIHPSCIFSNHSKECLINPQNLWDLFSRGLNNSKEVDKLSCFQRYTITIIYYNAEFHDMPYHAIPHCNRWFLLNHPWIDIKPMKRNNEPRWVAMRWLGW